MSFEPYDKALTLAIEKIFISWWKPVTTDHLQIKSTKVETFFRKVETLTEPEGYKSLLYAI